jgi:lipoprotein NlpI
MLARQPEDPFLHYALAMEWVKEGNIDTGLEQFDRVLALDPGYLGAYFQKAGVLIGQGRISDAQTTLKAGIDASRQKGDTHAADEMCGLLDTLNDDLSA